MFEFLHPLLVNIFRGKWNDPKKMKIENKIFLEIFMNEIDMEENIIQDFENIKNYK
jgi:hypothetical protein